ncbi:unnamed protein product [Moneuplotes crassus]|uniref:UBC core domain-containing protein n=1 Tax=Euplotes crassus TaxID=5936 RepID=A0AAD1XY50_EUPCR|nr:unnamed protein product [Moneuplotes crassus]
MILIGKKDKRAEEEEKKDDGKKRVKQSPAELRWRKEIGELDLPSHAEVDFPEETDICNFKVTVDLKNEDCLWKGGKYHFSLNIPKDYPHKPPKVHCDTQIYHPNINMDGAVCLNILRDDWKPILTVNAVILGLIFLFIEPNPEDPLNHEAAELMREDYSSFEDEVRRSLRGEKVDGVKFPKFI